MAVYVSERRGGMPRTVSRRPTAGVRLRRRPAFAAVPDRTLAHLYGVSGGRSLTSCERALRLLAVYVSERRGGMPRTVSRRPTAAVRLRRRPAFAAVPDRTLAHLCGVSGGRSLTSCDRAFRLLAVYVSERRGGMPRTVSRRPTAGVPLRRRPAFGRACQGSPRSQGFPRFNPRNAQDRES